MISEKVETLEELYSSVDSHLAADDAPSKFLSGISLDPLFKEHPFSMLYELKATKQTPAFHPEGSVWNHTLMVVEEAAKRRGQVRQPRALMWAALLHDIGKPRTIGVKDGRITAYGHDKAGAEMAREFLGSFKEPADFIDKVCYLVGYHMQVLYVKKRPQLLDIEGIRKNGDFKELKVLCLCDRLGRLGASRKYEEEQVDLFMRLCNDKERV